MTGWCGGRAGFDEMFGLVAGRFAQASSRWRARKYVLGLLSTTERKKLWTIAEQAGDQTPDGMQRLLKTYRWDADAVRDDLCGYALANLRDPSGVFVADETGFVKKETETAKLDTEFIDDVICATANPGRCTPTGARP